MRTKDLRTSYKWQSLKPIPPAVAIPPTYAVGSMITIDREADARAAVTAAAIPPGVAL